MLRYLILYFDGQSLSLDNSNLISLIEQSGGNPTRVSTFSNRGDEVRTSKLTKTKTVRQLVNSIGFYENISLDDPINGNYLNVNFHMRVNKSEGQYFIAYSDNLFPLSRLYDHLRLICEVTTPRYGFANVEIASDALFHPFGTSTDGQDNNSAQRVNDLFRSLITTKEHLDGKLHDLYPLNVLNDAHLDRDVHGYTLKDWIQDGHHGELRTVKAGVYAWIIPDDKRVQLREVLFKAGALIASV